MYPRGNLHVILAHCLILHAEVALAVDSDRRAVRAEREEGVPVLGLEHRLRKVDAVEHVPDDVRARGWLWRCRRS